jgi:hypothetical protein
MFNGIDSAVSVRGRCVAVLVGNCTYRGMIQTISRGEVRDASEFACFLGTKKRGPR